jgi:hypothetical protein
MTTGAGSEFKALDSLKLQTGKSYVAGRIVLDVFFDRFGTTDNAFAVTAGTAHFPLMVDDQGILTSPYTERSPNGQLVVQAGDRFKVEGKLSGSGNYAPGPRDQQPAVSARGDLRANLRITEGVISPGPSIDADFSGDFTSLAVDATFPSAVYKPQGDNHEERMYPVRMNARLSDEPGIKNSFSGARVSFKGGKMVADVQFPLNLKITVPEGAGEYKDKDDISKGGDGRHSKSQEVWRDKFGDTPLGAVATLHFHLMPRTYSCNRSPQKNWRS